MGTIQIKKVEKTVTTGKQGETRQKVRGLEGEKVKNYRKHVERY